jgi:hypothetical protein
VTARGPHRVTSFSSSTRETVRRKISSGTDGCGLAGERRANLGFGTDRPGQTASGPPVLPGHRTAERAELGSDRTAEQGAALGGVSWRTLVRPRWAHGKCAIIASCAAPVMAWPDRLMEPCQSRVSRVRVGHGKERGAKRQTGPRWFQCEEGRAGSCSVFTGNWEGEAGVGVPVPSSRRRVFVRVEIICLGITNILWFIKHSAQTTGYFVILNKIKVEVRL